MLSPKATQQPAQNGHDTEQKVLLLAGVMQGVALVTFPAISTVLTGKDGFGLSSSTYGLIFLPQVIAAITSSFLGGVAARRLGAKNVLMLGLGSDALAMAVLLLSTLVMHQQALSLPLLLIATALMGFGFGGVVPLLNTYMAAFQPKRIDQAVLMLNALLGLGTALAPALAALVVGPGIWWVLPLLVLVTAFLLLWACCRLPLIMPEASPQAAESKDQSRRQGAPLVVFLVVAALYGLNETLNGNWASLMMSGSLGSAPQQASLALTLFWALVTMGRLLFARFARIFPPRLLLVGLPGLLAVVFLGISRLSPGETTAGLILFALAGLGCSALLPLIISYGEQQLPQLGQSSAGILIAVYQVGYGLAAFGGGAVQEMLHLPMQSLFGWGAILAFFQALISFPICVSAKARNKT
jgi:MFS transporter, FHS family, glucose/mannose:H+ symporter